MAKEGLYRPLVAESWWTNTLPGTSDDVLNIHLEVDHLQTGTG